jgi:hypothetical protein
VDVLGERGGEALPLGDLVGMLFGHAEEFGDLNERTVLERFPVIHRFGPSPGT